MYVHLFEHFSSEGRDGFFNEVSTIFIDKVDPKDHDQTSTLLATYP